MLHIIIIIHKGEGHCQRAEYAKCDSQGVRGDWYAQLYSAIVTLAYHILAKVCLLAKKNL